MLSTLEYKIRDGRGVVCVCMGGGEGKARLLKFAYNEFEVTELCRTRADIFKPTLERTLLASQITKI